MSDDGESKSSKLARLSIILFNLLKKNEKQLESERILNAKYPFQNFDDEYPVLQYAY